MKYIQQRQTVDAMQYRKGMSMSERVQLLEMGIPGLTLFADGISIQHVGKPEGTYAALAREGDWIVRDSCGVFAVVSDERFRKLYSVLDGEQPDAEHNSTGFRVAMRDYEQAVESGEVGK